MSTPTDPPIPPDESDAPATPDAEDSPTSPNSPAGGDHHQPSAPSGQAARGGRTPTEAGFELGADAPDESPSRSPALGSPSAFTAFIERTSVSVDGKTLTRISDEDALAAIIRGEPIENAYIEQLHLGYLADSWVSPSDVGTTQYLADHFKVPTRIALAGGEPTSPIKPLRYEHPITLKNCIIGALTAVGCEFAGPVSLQHCHVRGEVRLSPPDAEELARGRGKAVVPPTRFGGRFSLGETRVDGRLDATLATIGGELDLVGARIEGDVRLPRVTLARGLDGRDLRLAGGGSLRLTGATVDGPVNLSHAVFAGGGAIEAERATFNDRVTLDEAQVHAADFAASVFNELLKGEHVRIAQGLRLSDCRFAQGVDLTRARVGDDFSMKRAVCTGPFVCDSIQVGNHFRMQESVFEADASFVRGISRDTVDCRDAVFKGNVTFKTMLFDQWAIFFNVMFEGDVDFFGARFEGECLFNKDTVSRDDEGWSLNERAARFAGAVSFRDAFFYRKVVLDGAHFPERATFDHAYFAEQVSIRDCRFDADVNFNSTVVIQEIDLRGSHFAARLLFESLNCPGRINLGGAKTTALSFANALTEALVIERHQVNGKLIADGAMSPDDVDPARAREDYSLLRNAFAKRGKLDEEDWAYANFKRRQRDGLKRRLDGTGSEPRIEGTIKRGIVRARLLVELVLFDWFSEYGTNPKRTGLLALIAIFGFGCFYFIAGLIGAPLVLEGSEIVGAKGELLSQPDLFTEFLSNIYFSFMAFTTMGFGDVHPHFYGWVKFVVALEAFVGVFIMTLFVGTYARKIIR